MTERDEAVAAIYKSIAHATTLSLEQWTQAVKDWEIIPIRAWGEIVGAVMRKGNEVHVGAYRHSGGAYRSCIRVLTQTIQQHGFATTKVRTINTAGLAFCLRLGFTITNQTGEIYQLRCERSRHAKNLHSSSCR